MFIYSLNYCSMSSSVLGIQQNWWTRKLWFLSTSPWVSVLFRILLRASLKIQLGQCITATKPVSFKRQSAYGSPCMNFSKGDLAAVVPLVTSLVESLDFFLVVVVAVDFVYSWRTHQERKQRKQFSLLHYNIQEEFPW